MGSLQGAIELVSAEPWSVGWAYERIALLLDQEAIPTSGNNPGRCLVSLCSQLP